MIYILILQEPCVHQTKNLGEAVKLSMDVMFKVNSSDEKFNYEWWFDDERIETDDEQYEVSDEGVLSIREFHKDNEGKYVCVASTTCQPVMSVSTEEELSLAGRRSKQRVHCISTINAFITQLLQKTLIQK